MKSTPAKLVFAAKVGLLMAGLALAGCVQTTIEASSDANLKPRDREQFAKAK